MFWTGFACGVVVTVALGVAAWHILSLYGPPRAADDPLDAVEVDYGAEAMFRRDGRATHNVTYWERASTIGPSDTGDNGHG